jgi:hypothetical protein
LYCLLFLLIGIIIKLIVDDYNETVISDIDQIINTITEKKPVKFISNGVELNSTFIEHYFKILDLEIGVLYDSEMIFKQVKKNQSFYQENLALGYKTRCNEKEILLAEAFILDNYNYIVHLN